MAIGWTNWIGGLGGVTGLVSLAWTRWDLWQAQRRERERRLDVHPFFQAGHVMVRITLRLDGGGEATRFRVKLDEPRGYAFTHLTSPGRFETETAMTSHVRELDVVLNPVHSAGSGWRVSLTLRLASANAVTAPVNVFSGTITTRVYSMSSRRRLICQTRALSIKA